MEKKEEECLSQLKELIRGSSNEYLKEVVEEDDFLRTFIIGRKYNVTKAFETASNHMTAKYGKYSKLYAMPAASVRHVLESGFFGVLKHRDPEGRLIGFMRIPKLDIKTMEFDELLRCAILLVDYFWTDRGVAENGQIFIIDYTGYNLSIFTRYTLYQKLSFATLFLNNYPTKFKEAHVYNNPRLVGYTFSFIKPFLPEKLRQRLFLHGSNLQGLHDLVSPDILPKWMGGKLSDEEAIDSQMITDILNKTKLETSDKIHHS